MSDMDESSFFEKMTPQTCDSGVHPDFAVDIDAELACPWCYVEQLKRILDLHRAHRAFPELVGVVEIGEMFRVSRQRANQLTKRPDFPSPVAHLRGGRVFLKDQVQEFGRNWSRKPGRPSRAVVIPTSGVPTPIDDLDGDFDF